ncbi:MAG: HAD-IB family phosphatase, partial [Candidatus Omnitrophica bacterium]|nr:HAD-IB family phosphatase [Candidatus Omnitrophota bacterium]
MNLKSRKLSDCSVFFVFYNTITAFDVLDDMIERFAVDKAWIKLEERWKKGEIGSKECLEGQMKSLRVTKKALVKYLDQIKIDPFTDKLFSMLRAHGVKPIILSDSFSLIIEHVLKANKIDDVDAYANTLKFNKDKLIPSFP